MSLSEKRILFGVHSFTAYSRTDGKPYGKIDCLKASSLALQGKMVDLYSGSNKFPWATEESEISAELSLKFSEYPAFLFSLFLGHAPTESLADTAGVISGTANQNGTSIINATNGISAIAVIPSTGAANLKTGFYTIVAVDSTHIDVYVSSDIEFSRGTAGAYQDDTLKVNTAPIAITVGTNDLAAFGLRFTGVGTPAFVTGDSARFIVKSPSTRSMEVQIGSTADKFPEFGAIVVGQQRGNKELSFIDVYKCKVAGMPLQFDQGAYSEADVKIKCLYDSAKDGVFKFLSHMSA